MDATGNLLIVDDNPNNLQILHRILSHAGYKVRPALSGEIALRAIESSRPDLILLDVRMAGLDGYETCEILKANPATAAIPIIFISALQDVQDKLRGFQVGGVDFVSKPFQEEEVLARVHTHFQIHQLQKELAYQNEHLNELVEAKAKALAVVERESSERLNQIAHLNRSITSSIFSSAIAHDLRQPLAAILSNAEAAELFLEQEPPPLQEIKEILADIRRDDLRASQIVMGMRTLLNKGESEIALHDLNNVVREVSQYLNTEAKQRGIQLEMCLYDSCLSVNIDRIQIQQVLVNLVINSMDALMAMPAPQRCIRISTISHIAYAEVRVEDNGPGFGEHLDQACESFFTTKEHGMGMGLPICASLIHVHQGHISVQDKDDGGAVVFFKLPLQE
ncbi:sensor histidine kinase [Undibacterium sp. Ji22W]|uniref:sensor histidine kinase n=1 Tax=Undibacterium sp. Ji22W TaxID=3413038 RepID=UPI003BF075DD